MSWLIGAAESRQQGPGCSHGVSGSSQASGRMPAWRAPGEATGCVTAAAMWWVKAKLLQIYSTLRSAKTEKEIDEEIRFHLDMRIRENLEAGYIGVLADHAETLFTGRTFHGGRLDLVVLRASLFET